MVGRFGPKPVVCNCASAIDDDVMLCQGSLTKFAADGPACPTPTPPRPAGEAERWMDVELGNVDHEYTIEAENRERI